MAEWLIPAIAVFVSAASMFIAAMTRRSSASVEWVKALDTKTQSYIALLESRCEKAEERLTRCEKNLADCKAKRKALENGR